MSSKKEEREEKRAAAAASIRPGWTVQSLASWLPREDKPELKQLRAEALKRNAYLASLRTAQELVTWLSRNGPTESTAASPKTMLLQVDSEGASYTLAPEDEDGSSGYDSLGSYRNRERKSRDDSDSDDDDDGAAGGHPRQLPATPTAPLLATRFSPRLASSSSSSTSSAPSTVRKNPSWSWRKDLPRLLTVVIDDIQRFASRDANLPRIKQDSGDLKPFWANAVVKFNDSKFETTVFPCPHGHYDASSFSSAYSGHRTDSAALETLRFNPLRKALDQAYGAFAISGGGDGGPVDPNSMYVMSSNFWNFCNGNLSLWYFYVVLAKYGALKTTVSAMDEEHRHGGDMASRNTSGSRRRTSGASDDFDLGAPVVIQQTDDQAAANKAKRTILEAQAMTAKDEGMAKRAILEAQAMTAKDEGVAKKDEFMATLISKLEEATSALEEYEGAGGFVAGSLIHKAKKARKAKLELNLEEMVGSE